MLIVTPLTAAPRPPNKEDDWLWTRVNDDGTGGQSGTARFDELTPDGELAIILGPLYVSWHFLTIPPHKASQRNAVLRALIEPKTLLEANEAVAITGTHAAGSGKQWAALASKTLIEGLSDLARSNGWRKFSIKPLISPGTGQHLAWFDRERWFLAGSLPESVYVIPASYVPTFIKKHRIESIQVVPQVSDEVEHRLIGGQIKLSSVQEILCQAANLVDWDFAGSRSRASLLKRLWGNLRQGYASFLSKSSWRLARFGLAGICGLLLIGPPVVAHLDSARLKSERKALAKILLEFAPDTPAVFDPVLQMQRRVEMLAKEKGLYLEPDAVDVLLELRGRGFSNVTSIRGEGRVWEVTTAGEDPEIQVYRGTSWRLEKREKSWQLVIAPN